MGTLKENKNFTEKIPKFVSCSFFPVDTQIHKNNNTMVFLIPD